MKLNCRIRERAFNALMISLVYLLTAIYAITGQAQSLNSVNFTESDAMSRVNNTGRPVQFDHSFNPEAVATPLNTSINSAYEEIKPVLTPCGKRLYFSRISHPNNTAGVADSEDIWYTEFDASSETWSQPIRMAGQLNNDGPNFVNNVSVTGDTLILGNQYGRNGKMLAGLSYSINKNGQWSAPQSIQVKNDYNISEHANSYVSLKSGVIIQAIERAETYGSRDLYVSFWNGEKATEPINMGGIINSELEESAPFLSADNKTLYFASKGHQGFGGYDIYVTKRLDDSWTNWSEPQNLGPAVNSNLNDEFFSITHCGNFAIFSRQLSVHNIDIFRISMEELLGKRKQEEKREIIQGTSALASL
jgi:OmpA-OmpF porin, OOP family